VKSSWRLPYWRFSLPLRRHRASSLCCIALCSVLLSSAAWALPILSLDVDPTTAGVQDELELLVGESFWLDVLISGVDAETPVNGYSFDLAYEGSVLSALSIEAGDFLTGVPIEIPPILGPPILHYGRSTLGPGNTGAGVLARIHFEAIAALSSPLTLALDDVLLGQPFTATDPLIPEGLEPAMIHVVPEPSSFLLVVLGLALLCGRRI